MRTPFFFVQADYSINVLDPEHRSYRTFAVFVAVLYCGGVPALSMWLLHAKKDKIKKLQALERETNEERSLQTQKWLNSNDPILSGLSPL